ncbi:heavy-metal-associated domain-containing protein [Geobacter sp. DSM 9736]|uniref:heavy-metal-associated domain-containing protein n=1 Tax=Geobacter sp. DSM 9736 TaxID=1277350 RepID=UPI000B5E511F|nr:heavy-metal-associated domain-containing protein [Geobacter sp. DSM 9736]SNB45389.1 Copper chaperone CopZ [Geobacter sp. DSM 9736]
MKPNLNKKTIINFVLVVAVLAVLGVLAFHVRIRPVAEYVAVLRTVGMTCGSCAGKIEKALMRLPGTAGVEVDVNGGWVLVGYDSKSAKPETFADAVNRTGFRSWLMEKMYIEDFRRIAGRDFGIKVAQSGCGGGCGGGKN